VILPFTLLRRLDCVLAPSREAVRKAAEKYKSTPAQTRDALLKKAAGQFYTPRDIIRLMVKLVFEPDRAKLAKEKLIAIYDPACGTGGMLTIAKEHLLGAVNANLDVYLCGQEINEKTDAVAKADMLMKGEDPENIKRENTLSHDLLPGKQFNYMLSNPPFGKDWKNIREEIEAEHAGGAAGRYAPGLPDVGDGGMLFPLRKLSKLPPQGGKIAIIFNGSPLFNGDGGSGPTNIRKHLLENDWLDAIVAMPNDLFYNTGIATYIWLINNRKPKERRGKVQLINANSEEFATKLRINLGAKRVEISEDQSASILGIYESFEETKVSKIFDTTDFGYTKVSVERPLRLRYDLTPEQRQALRVDAAVLKLKDDRGDQLAAALDSLARQAPWNDDAKFFAALTKALPWKLPASLVKTIRATLGVHDENAEPVRASSPLLRKERRGWPQAGRGVVSGRRAQKPMMLLNPIPNCEITRTCRSGRTLTNTSGARCCRMCPMRGWTAARTRRATKSTSPNTSTNTRRCAQQPRVPPNCSSWTRKPKTF